MILRATCQALTMSGLFQEQNYQMRMGEEIPTTFVCLGLWQLPRSSEVPAADQAPAPALFSLEEKDFARLSSSPPSSLIWHRTAPRPGDWSYIIQRKCKTFMNWWTHHCYCLTVQLTNVGFKHLKNRLFCKKQISSFFFSDHHHFKAKQSTIFLWVYNWSFRHTQELCCIAELSQSIFGPLLTVVDNAEQLYVRITERLSRYL